MPSRRAVSPRSVATLLVALLTVACGTSGPPPSSTATDGPLVVATTTILGDLVGQVVGDAGRVEVLMAPGQDPHGFAPSARQAERLRDADLVVANGLGLEEGALDALAAAEEDGVPVVHVAEEVDPIAPAEGDDEDAAHDGHDHDEGDPHVWFDPVRMATAVRLVGEALDTVAPGGDWAGRAGTAANALLSLDTQVAEILDVVPAPCRQLVTGHDELGYLAVRYDLEVVGTVVPSLSTSAAPSARDFAALAQVLRDTGAPAVFADVTGSSRLVDALAEEVGRPVAVVELYTGSLGEPGSGAETYRDLMVTDAERIAEALQACEAGA